MSYLLEALKRLEVNRQGGQTSDLLTAQSETGGTRKKRPMWPYVLSAALLANAAVGTWWLASSPRRPGSVVARPPAAQRVTTVSSQAKTPPKADVAHGRPPVTVTKPESQVTAQKNEVSKTEAGAPHASLRRQARTEPEPQAVVRPAPPPAPAPAAPKIAQNPQKTAEVGPQAQPVQPVQGKVTAATESSPGANSSLPELKMSLHSYSPDPRSRLVRINDTTLREGEALPAGVKVEEITPDGVVLSHDGRRLRLGVEQSR